jgi:hypothetical protein
MACFCEGAHPSQQLIKQSNCYAEKMSWVCKIIYIDSLEPISHTIELVSEMPFIFLTNGGGVTEDLRAVKLSKQLGTNVGSTIFPRRSI